MQIDEARAVLESLPDAIRTWLRADCAEHPEYIPADLKATITIAPSEFVLSVELEGCAAVVYRRKLEPPKPEPTLAELHPELSVDELRALAQQIADRLKDTAQQSPASVQTRSKLKVDFDTFNSEAFAHRPRKENRRRR